MQDSELAQEIVNTMKINKVKVITVKDLPHFRDRLSKLMKAANKVIITKTICNDTKLWVGRCE